jgi:hypothetical protein
LYAFGAGLFARSASSRWRWLGIAACRVRVAAGRGRVGRVAAQPRGPGVVAERDAAQRVAGEADGARVGGRQARQQAEGEHVRRQRGERGLGLLERQRIQAHLVRGRVGRRRRRVVERVNAAVGVDGDAQPARRARAKEGGLGDLVAAPRLREERLGAIGRAARAVRAVVPHRRGERRVDRRRQRGRVLGAVDGVEVGVGADGQAARRGVRPREPAGEPL